jgi:hypothetical protein
MSVSLEHSIWIFSLQNICFSKASKPVDFGANRFGNIAIFLRSRLVLQKCTDLSFSICKIFITGRTHGLLILVPIGSTVLEICPTLHTF